MKNILILICSILIYKLVNSQNTIKGKITNQDNIPLNGVHVYIPDIKKGTISNEDGIYELQNLPNGKVKIIFSFLGYGKQIETVELNGTPVELNVKLKETPLELEEIVVSGGYNSTQHENVLKIERIKLDEQKIATPNATDIITKIPGVDMISKGYGISKPVVRGLSMNDVLVLNNGFKFENYQYSEHHPLGIDEFGIESVEVIKGPASLLYGSDAIGGVINFIKEKPAPVGKLIGNYDMYVFSNTLGLNHNIGIKGSSKKIFGGMRIGQKSHADFYQGGGKLAPNSRFNQMSFKTFAGSAGRLGTFSIYYDFSTQKQGLVEDEAIERITKRGRKNEIFYQQFNTHMLSSQGKIYLNRLKLEINSSFQNTELIHFGDTNEYEIQMQLTTFNSDIKLYTPITKNSEIIYGIQSLNQINKNLNNRETKLLPDAFVNNYSTYALYTQKFNSIIFQTGIRYDHKEILTQAIGIPVDTNYRNAIRRNYNNISGSIGCIYNFNENFFIRINFASAYRTPNLAELTSKGQHELRYEIGNPYLKPAQSYESDVNLHYHINNLVFDIAGFYNFINNYIYIAPTSDTTLTGLKIYKHKQANSILYGGESSLHIHPKTLKWLHFETTFSYVIGKQTHGNYLPFIPAHKLNFEVKSEKENVLFFKKAFFTLNIQTAFKQNNCSKDETPTSGYVILNTGIGGITKAKNQEIMLGINVNNLLDTKYFDHLSTLKEVNVYNPGRNISFILKIPFDLK